MRLLGFRLRIWQFLAILKASRKKTQTTFGDERKNWVKYQPNNTSCFVWGKIHWIDLNSPELIWVCRPALLLSPVLTDFLLYFFFSLLLPWLRSGGTVPGLCPVGAGAVGWEGLWAERCSGPHCWGGCSSCGGGRGVEVAWHSLLISAPKWRPRGWGLNLAALPEETFHSNLYLPKASYLLSPIRMRAQNAGLIKASSMGWFPSGWT